MGVHSYYPWDEWFDGNQHTIVQGQDYNCGTASMISQLYTKAKTRGIKITVKPNGNSITFARKPILFAVAEDYYLVEEWMLRRKQDILQEASRRHMTFGGLVENMLDDALDSYASQSNELVESLMEDNGGTWDYRGRDEEGVAPSLRSA